VTDRHQLDYIMYIKDIQIAF